ncbi:tetratricopeptide repeat protein [Tepidibacter hydrothermalis]|uniref:Tetratricopeptide repeat protein n=1 Tax=Tepidibacter hydrothermalis TaxID=3036126 RepID=A0ABY8EFC9_9FIRM|nr:tetratricopeptide repeat protein [Tepidibacter hydrothermalis]WFD10555.1 tetratricopeptide repeat protein [Tepidibacter hydrothermalis]
MHKIIKKFIFEIIKKSIFIILLLCLILFLCTTFLPNYELYSTVYKETLFSFFWLLITISIIISIIPYCINDIKKSKSLFYKIMSVLCTFFIIPFLLMGVLACYTSFVDYLKDLKYVISNKPVCTEEIFLPTTTWIKARAGVGRSAVRNQRRVLIQTENLTFDLLDDGSYFIYERPERIGNIVKVSYLPNTNTLISMEPTGRNVSVKTALDIKAAKLKKSSHIYEHTDDEYLNIASLYEDIGDYKSALECYNILIDDIDVPIEDFIFYHRGLCYYETGEYTKALDDFDKSSKLLDSGTSLLNDKIHKGIGDVYFAQRDYVNALSNYTIAKESCKELRDIVPSEVEELINKKNTSEEYLIRSKHYMDFSDYDRAIENYTIAIDERGVSTYLPFYNRGLCYCEIGNYIKAIDDFNQSLRVLDTKNSRFQYKIYKQLGYPYIQLRDYKNALSVYNILQEEYGYFENDVSAMKELVEKKDTDEEYVILAKYYFDNEDRANTIKSATIAIEEQGVTTYLPFYYRGLSYCGKNFMGVINDFTYVLKVLPPEKSSLKYDICYKLGDAYIAHGDYASAIANFTIAKEKYPEVSDIIDSLRKNIDEEK